jgi:hypothetical protein
MKFEKVRSGEYRAQLSGNEYIWIVREAPHHWWWFIGDGKGIQQIWAENNGPFSSLWMATADAVAKYKVRPIFAIVWYVHRPTSMGRGVRPALWRMEPVIEGSERDKMLAAGRTVNDAGDVVEIPGDWQRFTSRAEAEAWIEADA